MDILIIAVLIIAAVILFLVELFVIPGISLAGISALVCILYANYYAFTNLGMAGAIILIIVPFIAANSGCLHRITDLVYAIENAGQTGVEKRYRFKSRP